MNKTRNYMIAKELIRKYETTGRDNIEILIRLQNMFNELPLETEEETLEMIVDFFQKVNIKKDSLNYVRRNYLALSY